MKLFFFLFGDSNIKEETAAMHHNPSSAQTGLKIFFFSSLFFFPFQKLGGYGGRNSAPLDSTFSQKKTNTRLTFVLHSPDNARPPWIPNILIFLVSWMNVNVTAYFFFLMMDIYIPDKNRLFCFFFATLRTTERRRLRRRRRRRGNDFSA